MNFLDVRTVMFSLIATDLVCTMVLGFLWFQNRKHFSGVPFWILNFGLQTAGTILIVLRGIIPDWMSMGVSNTLVFAGTIMGYIGLSAFIGKKSTQVHNFALLAVFVIIQFYFIFIRPNLEARVINLSVGFLVVGFQCVWLLLYRVEPGMRRITQHVGFIFITLCLISLARIAAILLFPVTNNDLFQTSLFDAAILVSYQVLLILLTFGMTLMVNKRLLVENEIQEEKFAKAFRSASYAITLTRMADGKILDVNNKFVALSGYQVNEVLGKTTLELKLWADESDRETINRDLSAGRQVLEREIKFRVKSGEVLTGLFTADRIMVDNEPWVLSSIIDITGRKQAQEELFRSEAKLRGLFASMTDVVIVYDRDGRYMDIAPTNPTSFVRPREEMLGRNVRDILPKERADFVIDRVRETIDTNQVISGEYTLQIDGKETWFAFSTSRISDATAIWVAHDITQQKRSEQVQNAISRITQTVITSADIQELYRSIHSFLAELVPADNFYIALYDPVSELISFPYYIDQYDDSPPVMTIDHGMTGYVIRTGRPILATREIFDRLIEQGKVDLVGTMGVDWLGVPLIVNGRIMGVMAVQSYTEDIHYDQNDLNVMEIVSTQVAQVIERKRLEEEIRILSLTDDLTRLWNRRGFNLLAEEELKQANRKKKKMLIFYGDVDDLKGINDTHGHAQGDQALVDISELLKKCFREGDILSRIGGDEFVVLAVDAGQENTETMTGRIRSCLEELNEQGNRPYQLRLSLGVTTYDPEAPCTVGELIARADALMYSQKKVNKSK